MIHRRLIHPPLFRRNLRKAIAATFIAIAALGANGQAGAASPPNLTTIVQDDFRNATTTVPWTVFGNACLMAGDGTSTIPTCNTLPAYLSTYLTSGYNVGVTHDAPGQGALRLTNGATNSDQGAIVSPTPFPSSGGLQITFTTVTYGGNHLEGTGADGMSFFLIDGARQYGGIGSAGGTLGYQCSNFGTDLKTDGMPGGYLGVGIDEYGNFLETSNTATGIVTIDPITHLPLPHVPNRIGMRGAGSVSWQSLHHDFPSLYPEPNTTANKKQAVADTCRTGHLQDMTKPVGARDTGIHVADYAAFQSYAVLPSSQPISYPGAVARSQAKPITFRLKLTSGGLFSFYYAYNGGVEVPVYIETPIASISPDNATIPSSFLFGFAASTGNGTNAHEIMCFKAEPLDGSASSAASNVQKTGEVKTGTQVYLAYFHKANFWGEVRSQNLVVDPATNTVSVSTTANWEAGCRLNGGNCPATGVTNTAVTDPATRNLITWNPASQSGINFQWTSLTTEQQAALNAGDGLGFQRAAYLRGDRTGEAGTSPMFRPRTSLLGDVMESSPSWVGPPSAPYSDTWTDAYAGSAAPTAPENATPYSTFLHAQATRLNVVYVGSNDGFLHGFRAGSYDGTGTHPGEFGNFVNVNNEGKEILGYMPDSVVKNIHSTNSALDYSSPQYGHNYFVDATPSSGDLYTNGQWRTWLAGGLGAGGRGLYILDVTNPGSLSKSSIVGEWSPATLSCSNSTTCGSSLGYVTGAPMIRRLHNGKWGIIFGNGLNSDTGLAGIYVMVVGSSGLIENTYFLNTGAGGTSAASADGISEVTAVDLDGDHITDYVYAGDRLGNVWRFDLTNPDPTNWGTNPTTALFKTASGQPITTQVQVISVPIPGDPPRIMVEFGTGQRILQTTASATQYATGQQAIYGIWDANFNTWNSISPNKLATLATAPGTIAPGLLQQQNFIVTTNTPVAALGDGQRTLSQNTVCWKISATCAQQQMGFVLPLAGTEQVTANPSSASGVLIVNTTIPPDATGPAAACGEAAPTGWTLALDPNTGGSLTTSFFNNAAGNPATLNTVAISGIAMGASGTGSLVNALGSPYLLNQTIKGTPTVIKVNLPAGTSTPTKGRRLTWIQLR